MPTHDCITTQAGDAAAALGDSGLHDSDKAFTVLQNRDVSHHIAVDDQDVAQFSDCERCQFMIAVQYLGAGLSCTLDDVQWFQADIVDKE